jgi:hypothetical protein
VRLTSMTGASHTQWDGSEENAKTRLTCEITIPCVLRLKEHLRQKLIEHGWRDQLKEYTMGAHRAPSNPPREPHAVSPLATEHTLCHCILVHHSDLIRSKGDTTMTVEQLTSEIIPRGRSTPRPRHTSFPPCLLSRNPDPEGLAEFDNPPTSGTVPDEIKAELLQRIRRFAEQQA